MIAEQSRSTPAERLTESFYQRRGKRALDLALGVPLLLLASPLILLLAVLTIVTSGWPPFYKAQRLGIGGRPFSMWKVRTMRRGAAEELETWLSDSPEFSETYGHRYKVERDPRITGFGRLIRSSSLDELPQLINVVKGDMSLVGPRPIVHDELANYEEHANSLLSVRPGLTGVWQTKGRGKVIYPDRIPLELSSCHTTFFGDVAILLRTLTVPVRFDGL